MNYIGSKKTLLPFIEKSILSIIDNDCTSFCDIFAGTGVVGLAFKKKDFKVIANDLQYYSYVLNKHYIANHKECSFNNIPFVGEIKDKSSKKDIIFTHLNNIENIKGFIYNNYSPNPNSDRMYLTSKNALKCDAIRLKIESWKNNKYINLDEYYFLISSLIESIDKYTNVLSVYGAYLKYFKKNASKDFILKPSDLIINDKEHEVYNNNANELIKKINPDILYIDPPYNSRQYATNYHFLETVAKYDYPKIHGKTGLREYGHQKSNYCIKSKAKISLKDLVYKAKAKYIFISYNDEGIISNEDIKIILEDKGRYGFFEQKYKRFKTSKKRVYKKESTIEYLHYCICK